MYHIKIVNKLTTHVKVQDIILGPVTSGGYADYLLLKNGYKNGDNFKKPKNNGFKQMLFNTKFLQHISLTHGELHCEYCGLENLRLYHWKFDKIKNKSDMATVDHFLPKSQFPELARDFNNLKVCCYKCNQDKKDDIWDKTTLKYPY